MLTKIFSLFSFEFFTINILITILIIITDINTINIFDVNNHKFYFHYSRHSQIINDIIKSSAK